MTLSQDQPVFPGVSLGRAHIADGAVSINGAVPMHEPRRPLSRIIQDFEPVNRKLWPELGGTEQAINEGVVIAHPGPGVRGFDAQTMLHGEHGGGLVEGVSVVQQREHDAQRHAGTPFVAGNGCALHLFAEEVQIWHGLSSVAFTGEDLSSPRFDLLPGHARGQHGQLMAQINHVVDARTEETGWVLHLIIDSVQENEDHNSNQLAASACVREFYINRHGTPISKV